MSINSPCASNRSRLSLQIDHSLESQTVLGWDTSIVKEVMKMDDSTRRKKRVHGLILAVVAGMLSVFGMVAPANATYSDYCWVTPDVPYANSGYLYTNSKAVCSSPRWPTLSQTVAQYYNSDSSYYADFGSPGWASQSSSNPILTSYVSAYCSGYGTLLYRTRGWGQNEAYEGSTYYYSSGYYVSC